MSAVGHYLEQAGIATVQISLVREHTAALNAPRALWVPFMLGRPFGAPGDSAFQRRVLVSALQLLTRSDGPVLEDFPDQAPPDNLNQTLEQAVCPVSFPSLTRTGSIASRINDEIGQLYAWHSLSVRMRGRTTLGLTRCSPSQLGAFVASWLTEEPKKVLHDPLLEPAVALKFATDELKAYYFEAKSMQPGQHTSSTLQDWFWFETTAGEILLTLREKLGRDGDPAFKGLATLSMVPRAVLAAVGGRHHPHSKE